MHSNSEIIGNENNNNNNNNTRNKSNTFLLQTQNKNMITINIINEDHVVQQNHFLTKLKTITSSPQAKDYLNDNPFSPSKIKNNNIQLDLKNKINSKLKDKEKILTENKNSLEQMNATNNNTDNNNNKIEAISPNLKTPQYKNSSSNYRARSLSSPFQIVNQKQTLNKVSTEIQKIQIASDSKQDIQKQNITKTNSFSKTVSEEKKLNAKKDEQEKNEKLQMKKNEERIKKDLLIQKKANSHLTLHNINSFHSKRQILKNIRCQPLMKQIESQNTSFIDDQTETLPCTETKRRLTRDAAMSDLAIQNFIGSNNIHIKTEGNQDNDIQHNAYEINNNNYKKNFAKSFYLQRKINLIKSKRESSINQNQDQSYENDLRTSDFFFHGNQSNHSKPLQVVRLNIEPNQETQHETSFNVFKNDQNKHLQSPQKSFRLSTSTENKQDKIDQSGNNKFQYDNNKFNSNTLNDDGTETTTYCNFIKNINHQQVTDINISKPPLELSKIFSQKFEQSIILSKQNNNEIKQQINSPLSRKNNFNNSNIYQNSPKKASSSLQSQNAQNSSIIISNSRGGKSPISNRHSGSRFSGFESGSMMFIEDDEEELKRQKNRRQKTPLNYLFQKYPEVIKENYTFMKMKMKQTVDIYDVLKPTTEEELIENFQKYTDNTNNKTKIQMMKNSSNNSNPNKMPLLKLKEGLNIQQKKLYSQINQMTHELEINKRQMKYLQTHSKKFNKTLIDLDNILIPSAEYNVSDFIYKNYISNKKESKDIPSIIQPSKRLITQ